MSQEKIKDWFNEFFNKFNTRDRSTVTGLSCKLFAEYVFNKQQERVAELESYNLGLANESHAQQLRIAELESRLNRIEVRVCDPNAKPDNYNLGA
ncbi:MAG: hypothetical protein ABNH21_06825 [Glaciecola sp.]|jgi:type VI protein secretion system component VasK